MKILIQRVKSGIVEVESTQISAIGKGYVLLVGIFQEDTVDDVIKAVQKLVNLRIMSDDDDKMNRSLKDVNGEILLVSQFTLCADLTFGRRPSFIKAMEPVRARKLYELMKSEIEKEGIRVQTGKFGHYMNVKIENDGPVTIMLDTRE